MVWVSLFPFFSPFSPRSFSFFPLLSLLTVGNAILLYSPCPLASRLNGLEFWTFICFLALAEVFKSAFCFENFWSIPLKVLYSIFAILLIEMRRHYSLVLSRESKCLGIVLCICNYKHRFGESVTCVPVEAGTVRKNGVRWCVLRNMELIATRTFCSISLQICFARSVDQCFVWEVIMSCADVGGWVGGVGGW